MWLYHIAKGILNPVYRLMYRVRVEGTENLPQSGGAILCGNHFHAQDPIMLGLSAPRPVSFMAKQELFQNRLLGWLLRSLGAFPVKRGQPDRAALKRSIEVLQAGGCFGIFPEGTRNRSGRLGKAEPGTAYLAIKSGAPVIPVGITSSYKLFQPIIVKFGPPVDLDAYRTGKLSSDVLEGAGHEIMAAIGALLVPPTTVALAQGE